MIRIAFATPAFLLFLAAPLASHAQDNLSGSWQHAGSRTEADQREAAIEASTEDISIFARSTARSRLAERTTPTPRIRIAVVGDLVQLTRGGRTMSLTVGGPAIQMEGERGTARVRATRRNGHLVVTARGESGSMTTSYRLSEDGLRLVLSVQLSAERLSTPLRYRVTYRRA